MFAPIPISRPPSEGLFSPFGLQSILIPDPIPSPVTKTKHLVPQAISTIPAPPPTTTAAHLRPAPTRNTATRNTASTPGTTNTTAPQPHYNPHLHWVKAYEASHSRAKTNIARFGATWLRPAGCSKTLQAQEDEAAERAEQEEQERRQRGLAEAVAAQEADERRRRATGGVGDDGTMEGVVVPGLEGQPAAIGEGGEGLGMERDLDDEVPEGDGQENVDMDEGDEEEDEDEEDGDEDADSSEEELDNPPDAVFDEEDEGGAVTMERNLDSDIPEASGEYEHTDTDIEDETEEISISQGLDGTSEVDLRSSTLSRQQQSQQRRSAQRQQQPQQPRPQYQQEQIQPPRTGFGTVSAYISMGMAMSSGVFTSSPNIEHEGNASSELESSVFGPSEAGPMSGSPSMGMMRPPGVPRRR